MKTHTFRCLVMLSALVPIGVNAATTASSEVYSKEQLLSVGASLAAVLLMVVVLGFVARSFSTRLGGNQLIKVLSNLPVGTRERVVLLEVSGKKVLVGASAGSVSLLHVFDELSDTDDCEVVTEDFLPSGMTRFWGKS